MTLPARWDVPEPLAVCEVRAADGASIFVRRHGNPNGPRFVLSHGNGFSRDMESVGHRLGMSARRRRDRFETPEDYAERLSRREVFERLHPAIMDLFARTTLRRTADGTGYELRCPREYEAQIYDFIPETTHLLLLEKPDACADLVLDFLESRRLV